MTATNLAMEFKPTIWHRLGFGERRPYFEDEEDEAFAPGFLVTETYTILDWKDRIRILVSGKVLTACKTRTDQSVFKAETVSKFSVLPPQKRVHTDAKNN